MNISNFWKDPRVRFGMDILIVFLLLWSVALQFQVNDEVHSRQEASFQNCTESNDARQVVVNIMKSAEALVQNNPSYTKSQKDNAVKFYEDQIKQIKFTDCSAFVK